MADSASGASPFFHDGGATGLVCSLGLVRALIEFLGGLVKVMFLYKRIAVPYLKTDS